MSRAETESVQADAFEVIRVLEIAGQVLAELPGHEAAAVYAQWLAGAHWENESA